MPLLAGPNFGRDENQYRSSSTYSVSGSGSSELYINTSDLNYKIVNVKTYEESFATDTKVIDVSKSASTQKRCFDISKEWVQTYALKHSEMSSALLGSEFGTSSTTSLKLNGPVETGVSSHVRASIKASTESKIVDHYSISSGEKIVCSERIEVNVPAYTKTKLLIQWKYVWHEGLVEFSCDKLKGQTPFTVLAKLTFDTQQIDQKKGFRRFWS